jgi:hypothetical protein
MKKILFLAAAGAFLGLVMAGCASVYQTRQYESSVLLGKYEQLKSDNSPDAQKKTRSTCPFCAW